MSTTTTIIPGVSPEIELEYIQSFNAGGYMFTVSVKYGALVRQFYNCGHAAQFVYEEPFLNTESEFKTFIISLNKTDGEFITLNNEDVSALCKFEDDEDLFEMFKIFAENMTHARGVSEEAETFDEEELSLTRSNSTGPKLFNLAQDIYNESMKDYPHYDDDDSEDIYGKALDELSGLRCTLRELNKLLDERNTQIAYLEEILDEALQKEIKATRDGAMLAILSMTPHDFQNRLLSDKQLLPQFERAVPGDSDYPDLCQLQRQIAAPFSKFPLTLEEFDNCLLNEGEVNRDKLRYMTEEEFKTEFYDLVPRHINPSLVNDIKFDN